MKRVARLSRNAVLRISRDQLHDVLRRGRRLHRIQHDFELFMWRDGAELFIELNFYAEIQEGSPNAQLKLES